MERERASEVYLLSGEHKGRVGSGHRKEASDGALTHWIMKREKSGTGKEASRASEGYSRTGEHRVRDKSGHGK